MLLMAGAKSGGPTMIRADSTDGIAPSVRNVISARTVPSLASSYHQLLRSVPAGIGGTNGHAELPCPPRTISLPPSSVARSPSLTDEGGRLIVLGGHGNSASPFVPPIPAG